MWQRIKEFAASSDTTQRLNASRQGVLVTACVLNLGLYVLGVHAVRADETVARLIVASVQKQPTTWVDDLSPIAERDWSSDYAAHLLDRTGFGGTPDAIRRLAAMTPPEAVDYIVDYASVDASEYGGARAEGTSLDERHRSTGTGADGFALKDLMRAQEWEGFASDWGHRMLTTPTPFKENMTLFWQRHFASVYSGQDDPRFAARFTETLRTHATGNLRELLAAVLSNLDRLEAPQDTADRQRPAGRYDNHALVAGFALGDGVQGDFDGIESIVGDDRCAPFISSRIYRYFVRNGVSPSTSDELARVLRQSDYELRPLLKMIFLSRDFYSRTSMAATVQSPVHYYVSACRKLAAHDNPNTSEPTTAPTYAWNVSTASTIEYDRGAKPRLTASTERGIGNMWRQLLFPVTSSPALRDR